MDPGHLVSPVAEPMTKRAEYSGGLQMLPDSDVHLLAESGPPDPRGNIELARHEHTRAALQILYGLSAYRLQRDATP